MCEIIDKAAKAPAEPRITHTVRDRNSCFQLALARTRGANQATKTIGCAHRHEFDR